MIEESYDSIAGLVGDYRVVRRSSPNTYAFTVKYPEKVRTLTTEVIVSVVRIRKTEPPPLKPFVAVWDTGATDSAITKRVADSLGLKSIGVERVHTVGGIVEADVYLVNIGLPNQVVFPARRVTEGEIGGADVLIGMDIIGEGDFAVTSKGGETWMSYSLPSTRRLDFVRRTQQKNKGKQRGR